jgi:hypothetical protein
MFDEIIRCIFAGEKSYSAYDDKKLERIGGDEHNFAYPVAW